MELLSDPLALRTEETQSSRCLWKPWAERIAAQGEIISFSGNEENLQERIVPAHAEARGTAVASHFVAETTSRLIISFCSLVLAHSSLVFISRVIFL